MASSNTERPSRTVSPCLYSTGRDTISLWALKAAIMATIKKSACRMGNVYARTGRIQVGSKPNGSVFFLRSVRQGVDTSSERMKVKYYGHSCFAVEIAGKTLLFDPFISGNELARTVDVGSVPADYILVSHGHYDHVGDTPAIAQRTGATVISNFEVVTWLGKQGVSKTHPLNHGGAHRFDFGSVKFVNAIHSSSLPDGSYGGNRGRVCGGERGRELLFLRGHGANDGHEAHW